MKKYKVINKSDLTNEEIGSLIDIVSNILYNDHLIKLFKNYKTSINWNNKNYYIFIKCGMIHNKFIIKQKNKDDRK